MILRRFITHFRKQEWTPIAIDFVIVVVGVFVGLQVNNWNEARGAAQREKDFLFQLREEVEDNNEFLRHRVAFTRIVVSAGERIADLLTGAEACEEECEQRLVDAFLSSQLWGSDLSEIVATEMQRQGLPRSLPLKKEMRAYYNYSAGLEKTLETAAHYRVRARRLLPPRYQRKLWSNCFSLVEGTLEVLDPHCDPGIDNAEARAVLEGFRQTDGLLGDLNYWVGQNELWIAIFQDQVTAGEKLIGMIGREIEGP